MNITTTVITQSKNNRIKTRADATPVYNIVPIPANKSNSRLESDLKSVLLVSIFSFKCSSIKII